MLPLATVTVCIQHLTVAQLTKGGSHDMWKCAKIPKVGPTSQVRGHPRWLNMVKVKVWGPIFEKSYEDLMKILGSS